MKKYLYLISLIAALTAKGAAPIIEFDLRKGVDFTASNNLTAALLNQLVDAGTISATNKGGVLRKSSLSGFYWPNVTDNPRYTNFIWIDTFTPNPVWKTYVCCGDAYSNWVGFTPGPQTISSLEIKDYTIQTNDMATNSIMTWALLDNSVTTPKLADQSVTTAKIGPLAVGRGSIAFGAIQGGDITNKTITYTNIADGTIQAGQMAGNFLQSYHISNKVVLTANMGDTNVTRNQILDDAIGTSQVTNKAITAAKIADITITTNQLTASVAFSIPNTWGLINGTTLLKGFNVGSIVSGGTGFYLINFITPQASTNYCVIGSVIMEDHSAGQGRYLQSFSNTTSSVWISVKSQGGADQALPFSFLILGY